MSTILSRAGLVAAVAFGVAACGGGGSSSPVTPDSPDQNVLGLSASNYQAVGQASMSSAFYLGNASGLVSGSASGRVGGAGALRHAQVAGRPQALAVVGPIAVPCDQGGSLSVTFSDLNNNGEFEVGDSLSLDAAACKLDGAVTQGRVDLSLQSLTGVYGSRSFSAGLTLKLTAFGVSQGSNSLLGDGSLTASFSQTVAGTSEFGLTVPRLSLTGRVAGQSFSTTLTDVQLSLKEDTVNGSARTRFTYGGTLLSSVFDNKQVQVSTPQELVIQGTDDYPSSGVLLVRGKGNSTLRITAVNAVQARLELDAEGDGVFETSVLKNWADLR